MTLLSPTSSAATYWSAWCQAFIRVRFSTFAAVTDIFYHYLLVLLAPCPFFDEVLLGLCCCCCYYCCSHHHHPRNYPLSSVCCHHCQGLYTCWRQQGELLHLNYTQWQSLKGHMSTPIGESFPFELYAAIVLSVKHVSANKRKFFIWTAPIINLWSGVY